MASVPTLPSLRIQTQRKIISNQSHGEKNLQFIQHDCEEMKHSFMMQKSFNCLTNVHPSRHKDLIGQQPHPLPGSGISRPPPLFCTLQCAQKQAANQVFQPAGCKQRANITVLCRAVEFFFGGEKIFHVDIHMPMMYIIVSTVDDETLHKVCVGILFLFSRSIFSSVTKRQLLFPARSTCSPLPLLSSRHQTDTVVLTSRS